MHIRLEKLVGGDRIRTDCVEGACASLPNIGDSLTVVAESLSFKGGHRLVQTSAVQAIVEIDPKNYVLETMNSTYKVTILAE